MDTLVAHATYLGLALSLFVYGMDYISPASIAPETYAYAGSAIALVLSLLGSSFGIAMTSNAIFTALPKYYQYAAYQNGTRYDLIKDDSSPYAGYRLVATDVDVSDIDNGGYYIMIVAILFFVISVAIALAGYFEVERLFKLQRAHSSMTHEQGYKFLALGTVMGIGAWASGLIVGDAAWEFLGWYGGYFAWQKEHLAYYLGWIALVREYHEWEGYTYQATVVTNMRNYVTNNRGNWWFSDWRQICKTWSEDATMEHGVCVEFYPPEESWNTDAVYSFSTLGVFLLIASIQIGAGYYLGYELTSDAGAKKLGL